MQGKRCRISGSLPALLIYGHWKGYSLSFETLKFHFVASNNPKSVLISTETPPTPILCSPTIMATFETFTAGKYSI